CRVFVGQDFVGDEYEGISGGLKTGVDGKILDSRIARPKADPMDCSGHGTHVASIIGGIDKNILGVAPNVTFGAYKVFGCNGGVESDVLIQAMEQAYIDGMDVINLSGKLNFRRASGWADYPTAIISELLVKRGVLVVAAMGNDGKEGLWEVSEPAVNPFVIAVASSENSFYIGGNFSTTLRKNISFSAADVYTPKNMTISIINEDACNPLKEPSVNGTMVLIQRGGCSVKMKMTNLAAVGALALMTYNFPENEIFVFAVEKANKNDIPVFGLGRVDGENLYKDAQIGIVRVEFNEILQIVPNSRMGNVADYNSWGPGPNLEMKP
ncbi:hypothetical protein HK096_010656, partial [Nowakowskiella sp. JEL0078]